MKAPWRFIRYLIHLAGLIYSPSAEPYVNKLIRASLCFNRTDYLLCLPTVVYTVSFSRLLLCVGLTLCMPASKVHTYLVLAEDGHMTG